MRTVTRGGLGSRLTALSGGLIATLVVACSPSTEPAQITRTRVIDKAAFPVRPTATSFDRFATIEELRELEKERERQAARGQQQAAGPPYTWEVPDGWEELPPTELRLPNLRVKAHPEAECYLTVLQGDGGGALLNINRWRRQLGMEETDAAGVAALERRTLFGREAPFLQIDGSYKDDFREFRIEDARIMALILELPVGTLTVKMIGPREVLAAEADRYQAFCDSLKLRPLPPSHQGGAPHGGDPHAGAVPGATALRPEPVETGGPSESGGLRWTNPEGWLSEGARGMRRASFQIGRGSELSVISAGGGLADNVNRWLGQFGAPALTAEQVAALPTTTLLGAPAVLVEASGTFKSMGERNDPGFALLGAISSSKGMTLKLVGPQAEVEQHRAKFHAFVGSLEEVQ